MISPNSFDHETFEEEVNETTRLYKAIKIISSF
jgi:hypothetical protein